MVKDPTLRILHVLEEIEILNRLRKENDLEAFANDPVKVRAAAYSLQNISEAIRNIPPELLPSDHEIEWAKIKGLGNVTRHQYFRVDPNILWEAMTSDIDRLKSAMLASLDSMNRNI